LLFVSVLTEFFDFLHIEFEVLSTGPNFTVGWLVLFIHILMTGVLSLVLGQEALLTKHFCGFSQPQENAGMLA
jgi:hypothetical protein